MELELLEQQHLEMQELVSRNQEQTETLLKGIIDALSKENNNEDIVKAINDNINTFVKGIKLQAPEVTVEPANVNVIVNQDKVIAALEDMIEKNKPLPQKEKTPEKWKFDFIRDEKGNIISATANQIK